MKAMNRDLAIAAAGLVVGLVNAVTLGFTPVTVAGMLVGLVFGLTAAYRWVTARDGQPHAG